MPSHEIGAAFLLGQSLNNIDLVRTFISLRNQPMLCLNTEVRNVDHGDRIICPNCDNSSNRDPTHHLTELQHRQRTHQPTCINNIFHDLGVARIFTNVHSVDEIFQRG